MNDNLMILLAFFDALQDSNTIVSLTKVLLADKCLSVSPSDIIPLSGK